MYKVSLYLDKKNGDTCHHLRLVNTLKDSSRDEELVARTGEINEMKIKKKVKMREKINI